MEIEMQVGENPVCPYCDARLTWRPGDVFFGSCTETATVRCIACYEVYIVERQVVSSYTTRKMTVVDRADD